MRNYSVLMAVYHKEGHGGNRPAAYNAKKKLYHKYQVIGLQLYTADLHFDLRSVLKLIKRASTIAYGKVCNTFFRSWKKEWLRML